MMPSTPAAPSQSPRQVFEQALRLFTVGDDHEAAQRASLLRAHFPDEPGMLALHGMIVGAMGMHELAAPDLRRAAELTEANLADPSADADGRERGAERVVRLSTQLSRSLEALGASADSDAASARALELRPSDRGAVMARVEVLAARGDLEGARAVLAGASDLDEHGAAMCEGAIALCGPETTGELFRMLAQRVRALTEVVGLDAPTQSAALRRCGALFDRAGETDEAFRAFTRSSKLKRGRFDVSAHAKVTRATVEAWTAGAMGRLTRPSVDGSSRVFVVAPPGAGCAALGRALAAASGAGSVGPCEALTTAAVRQAGAKLTPHRPMLLEVGRLRGAQIRAVSDAYLAGTARLSWPGERGVVVDANPLHGHLIGLAAAALPGARFVFLRREARANTLACYFRGMRGHHPYSNDLATTASYLRDIRTLMDHWEGLLGSMGHPVASTTREALRADPAGETARVLSAIGLDAVGGVAGPSYRAEAADRPERYARRLEGVASFLE
ncbi:MAG: sulfotransferase [Phycisphaerales bacterium]|nr:sulfotransferase [Planctomycetota bacterium]MCH8507379.1 sulfotransferase [Phycisphaerales bacterium]